MNMQTHHSGQIPGQVPNQVGTMLPGLTQQNLNPMPSQMQNSMIQRNLLNSDLPDLARTRRHMQERIMGFISKRHPPHEVSSKKMADIVKRLEEGLAKDATTMEEYTNLETLDSRLRSLIKRSLSNNNQQFSHPSSTHSIGTMIPTPGLTQTGISGLIRSSNADSSLVAHTNMITSSGINSGNFFPNGNGSSVNVHGGSFNSSDGALVNRYQASASNIAVNSGVMMTSLGTQRMSSQMIPTPGFNDSNTNGINSNANNLSFVTAESSSNTATLPAMESTIVSQSMQLKQHVGGQNSHILHNISGHMGGETRSTLQQKSYGLSNETFNGGLSMIGNKMSMMNGQGTTDNYLAGTMYGNSIKPMHRHFDQNFRPTMQGDGYEPGVTDAVGTGNLYASVNSTGLTMNTQNINHVSNQKSNPLLMTNQLVANSTQQVTAMKSQSIDQSRKMNFQTQYAVRENFVNSHQHQQFQQPSHQFHHQQLIQHNIKHNQQQPQDQNMLKNNTFVQPQLQANVVSEVQSGHGIDNRREGLHSQMSDSFVYTDVQSHFLHNSTDDQSRAYQLLSHPSGSQDIGSSLNQTSDQSPLLHPHSEFASFAGGIQPDGSLQGQWCSISQDASQVARFPTAQSVQDEFHHRLAGRDVAQLNNLSSEESNIAHSDASRPEPFGSNTALKSFTINREQQFKNQQRWILFLLHARRCPAPVGQCLDRNCSTVQKLLKHMECCNVSECSFTHCHASKHLINHNRICRDAGCPVCVPVREFVLAHQKNFVHSNKLGLPSADHGSCRSYDTAEIPGKNTPEMSLVKAETHDDLQPSAKRVKMEHGSRSLISESESSVAVISSVNELPLQNPQQSVRHCDPRIIVESKMETFVGVGQSTSKFTDAEKDKINDACVQKNEDDILVSKFSSRLGVQEVIKVEKDIGHPKPENIPLGNPSKPGKPKIKGVSLIELFAPEDVQRHITGLRQWVGQSKAKAEKNQAMEHSMSENSCQLCAVEKLTFEPPPMYCTPCGARIKRNAMYYTITAGETRHYFCIPCYNEARGDTIVFDGTTFPKARMEKKKNDEETEEWWVQCDKCEAWQHQICALFNGKRNDGGEAEYTCPNCYIIEVEKGERVPLSQSAVLGAKDLPRTILSDHIEHRLFLKLKQERQDRARLQGKCYDEVPGAEALVVRVVSSVDKKLEVKPRFLEIFQDEKYSLEFPYKSKVILLFQKIEGVEVCLFGMYVQEFGSECLQPNNRRVYLSYLDSVKYFRPEVRAVTGEALRTFVYHEILIGYLDYCKRRGFTSCYIWACPPLKGEDYILYCHPEIQKTPKSDKLREWYLAMLRKAKEERIVTELTNLYDHFFTSTGECKSKVTATRLPYFDGDYWPGAAEDMIYQLQQEEDGKKPLKKGIMKKTITKRALKASGQTDLSGNASKDLLLMHKLGETIFPMKEDFIMVHLQHSCTHCCILMVSGNRWVCKQCKNFQLCDKCYEVERKREDRERHPINQKDKHTLNPVEITGVPDDTKDKDDILESEFFDTRQAFLSLCQGNHYQYDTLRRAKHSSMMVLYHLHNPTAPAFMTTCNMCHLDIESGHGWRCETCPDYDLCNSCYRKDGGINHPHKLTNHPSNDRDAQSKEAREMRVTQLRKMLDLLVHASKCRSALCQYPNCRKVKALFRHGISCKVRASGGCLLCKRMWYTLQLHARACKEFECTVPRCRDLKVHMRRIQQQSESRRRAAVIEMMRQRAEEVAGSF